jgi:hypothetical protein
MGESSYSKPCRLACGSPFGGRNDVSLEVLKHEANG